MIGAGMISQYHLVGWRETIGADVVAICDADRSRAQTKAEAFDVAHVFDSAKKMLRSCRLDAVDIVTPVDTHAPMVRLAADHGLHVMCQKPMAASALEASALVDYVGDRVRFMIHENYRYRPHYRMVRQWLAEDRIGAARMARLGMRCSGMHTTDASTPWLLERQPYLASMPRLLIFESLIHHLDVLRALLGELTVHSVQTRRLNSRLAGEDSAVITLCGNDGMMATLDGTFCAPGYPPLPRDHLEIVGTRGTLVLDFERLYLVGNEDSGVVFDLAARYQECFTVAIGQFVDGIRRQVPFESDRMDNLKTLRLVESCYRAASDLSPGASA